MQSIRSLLLAVLCLAGMACTDSRPDHILDEPAMAGVFRDIILINAGIDLTTPFVEDRKKVFVSALSQLLSQRGIQQEDLLESYSWYLYHPSEMEIVMQICQDSLSALQVRTDAPDPVLNPVQHTPENALVPKFPH